MKSKERKKSKDWFAEHSELERVREDAFILRECASSLMSDTKWRKLVAAISAPEINVSRCYFKFLETPAAKLMSTQHEDSIITPTYIDSEFGPFRFRAIEWLEFPRSFVQIRYTGDAGTEVLQDIGPVRRAIEALGQYPIEETERGFRIVGHILRKPPDQTL